MEPQDAVAENAGDENLESSVDNNVENGVENNNENDVDETPVGDAARSELKRRGDVEKCPVCGSRVDEEAYHCAACHCFYCYHCRARLAPSDPQLQCINQQCDYYGKLACDVCDQQQEKDEPPVVFAEPYDGFWPAWLLLILVAIPVLWYYTSAGVAFVSAVATFTLGGFLLQQMGVNLFGIEKQVEHHRKSTYYSCICCHQPVKELRDKK